MFLDHSIPQDLHNAAHCQRYGDLNNMLKASQAEDGKALNTLDLPRAIKSDFPRHFSSDVIAWDLLQGDEFCRDQYPMSFLRWGLCATAGAYH